MESGWVHLHAGLGLGFGHLGPPSQSRRSPSGGKETSIELNFTVCHGKAVFRHQCFLYSLQELVRGLKLNGKTK